MRKQNGIQELMRFSSIDETRQFIARHIILRTSRMASMCRLIMEMGKKKTFIGFHTDETLLEYIESEIAKKMKENTEKKNIHRCTYRLAG